MIEPRYPLDLPDPGGSAATTARVQRGMILAAGLGTRLRPLTDHLPKPMIPVLGRPLLAWVVDAFREAGIHDIAINTHHLPEAMERGIDELRAPVADSACDFTVFHEPEILGTGGGLSNARDFLARDEHCLVHNADVLTDLDLTELVREHLERRAWATLALVDWDPANTVMVDAHGVVRDLADQRGVVPSAADRFLTYAGVAVLSRELFRFMPTAGFSSLVDALVAAIGERADAVRGYAPPHVYWNDLGTIERYLDAHRDLLVDSPLRPHRLLLRGGRDPGVRDGMDLAPGSDVAAGAQVAGFVSAAQGARIEAGASVEDCVLLPGATVPAGARLESAVIGSGWEVSAARGIDVEAARAVLDLDIVRGAGFAGDTRIERITGHGSDRGFWRLIAVPSTRTAVLMRTTPEDEEFERYLAIGTFLHEHRLGGPEIIAVDPERRAVLMEDVGETSLYGYMRDVRRRGGDQRAVDVYRRVLDQLVELQTRGTVAAGGTTSACPEAVDRLFDYDTLRWETDYFRRRFLGDLAGVPFADRSKLDDEFHRLAEVVLEQPVVLMHRDFQSQNIFLMDDRVRLVDFQGMRRGPIGYDPMSLLRDAYVELGVGAREALAAHYLRRLAAAGGPELAPGEWRAFATQAGLQRNMQALGAFGFLSRVKEKPRFRRYIPLALRHLAAGLLELRRSGLPPGPLVQLERVVFSLYAPTASGAPRNSG